MIDRIERYGTELAFTSCGVPGQRHTAAVATGGLIVKIDGMTGKLTTCVGGFACPGSM
jgi:hypothetical protein